MTGLNRRGVMAALAGCLTAATGTVAIVTSQPAPAPEPSYPLDGETTILELEALGFRFELIPRSQGFAEWFPQYPLSAEQDRARRDWLTAYYADPNGAESCVAFLKRRTQAQS